MKKKILYVHHGKGLGGAPLSLLYLIEGLDKTKYHPKVLFLHDSDALTLFKSKNIDLVGPINRYDFSHTQIWWFRWYHIGPFFRSLRDTIAVIFSRAPYWLDLIKPDIIHLNTSSLGAWAYAAHKKKIPVVWHVREPLAKGYFGIRKRITIQCIKKYATAILPICKDNAQPWHDHEKTQVVYNAVPESLFSPAVCTKKSTKKFLTTHNLKQTSPKILFLGGLSQEKGTLEIFKIFQKLLKQLPDAKLLVAGYFEQKNRSFLLNYFSPTQVYQKKVMRILATIKDSTILLGPINNVAQAMAASDVIVFPAIVGHFARPIIEAGFMKKPVIASNLAPLNELVLPGKTGFLIDHHNLGRWVEQLILILSNQDLKQTMGQSAFDFCTQHFDIKDQITKIESVYESVILK